MWCSNFGLRLKRKSEEPEICQKGTLTADLTLAQQRELRLLWIHAVRTDTNAIGWLPTKVYDVRENAGDISALHRNGDCVGWVMATPSRSRGVMKVYQIWVRPDARIIEHGRALMLHVAQRAEKNHCYQIEAWVAHDLPANLFWESIGFTRKNWRHGKGRNNRIHWRWCVELTKIPVRENGRKIVTQLAEE